MNTIFDIEQKQNSQEMLDYANGKPTKFFLFADEFNTIVSTIKEKEDSTNKSQNPNENGNTAIKFWSIAAVKEYINQWWNAISLKTINGNAVLGIGNIDTTPPFASETVAGIVSTSTQTFKGNKVIKGDGTKPTTENTFEVQGINNAEKLLEIGSGGVNAPKFRARGGQYGYLELSGGVLLKIGNTLNVDGYSKALEFANNWRLQTENYGNYGLAFMNIMQSSVFTDAPLYIRGGYSGGGFQNIGFIGVGTTNPLAKLDITSTNSGFLPPRMTTAQKLAIVNPVAGLVVYDTTLGALCNYTTSWQVLSSAETTLILPMTMINGTTGGSPVLYKKGNQIYGSFHLATYGGNQFFAQISSVGYTGATLWAKQGNIAVTGFNYTTGLPISFFINYQYGEIYILAATTIAAGNQISLTFNYLIN